MGASPEKRKPVPLHDLDEAIVRLMFVRAQRATKTRDHCTLTEILAASADAQAAEAADYIVALA